MVENGRWPPIFERYLTMPKATFVVNDHPQRGWLEGMHLEGAMLPT